MSNCSGLTDDALESMANSIAASHAQEVDGSELEDAENTQQQSVCDTFGDARAGSTSRFYIQVSSAV